MPVSVFITTFARNVYSKENWARYDKYAYVFMQSIWYSFQILINLEFSQQIFENYSSHQFQKICPLGAELLHVGGRTNMTNLTVVLRKFAKKPKTSIQNQIYLRDPIIPNIYFFQ